MPTNLYFRNYDNFNEQNLLDDLVVESIRMYGIDVIYITRSYTIDPLTNESRTSVFDQTFEFEAYVKSADGFEGEGDFMSKFGLEIRDSVTFSVAMRTFERYVTKEVSTKIRPFEGDLIYFPLNKQLFEIKFTENEEVFYQMGALNTWELRCELMEYSNDIFQTGRSNIDNYFRSMDTSANTATLEALGLKDLNSQNLDFETTADGIIDFSEIDPFSESISIPDNN